MMVLKQMIIPIRKQVQSFVMRITGVPFASSGGENKAKGFSQSPTVKRACIKEISDEKYLMNKWLSKPDAYGMNVVLPLIVSDVPNTLACVYAIGGMLTGFLGLLITRMAKRLTYGDKISISEHDVIRKQLELSNMKESAQEEISKLINTKYKLQIESAQEEISKLEHCLESAQEEISKLEHCLENSYKEFSELNCSIMLQIKSSEEEIYRLNLRNWSVQEEISKMKHSQELAAKQEICMLNNNHQLEMMNARKEIRDLKQMLKLRGKRRKVLDCTKGEIRDV